MNVDQDERVPFQITHGSRLYDSIGKLPVTLLLEDFRSLFNVGSVFRTVDAAGGEGIVLCGITGQPPQNGIAKTALGAENTVRWTYEERSSVAINAHRERGYEIAVLETSMHSVDLYDWRPHFPVLLVLGNELDGISKAALDAADTHIRIPMLGLKHSLNVSTAAGIAVYELLRKYRELVKAAQGVCAPTR